MNTNRHENTIYQQIFPAQIPIRRLTGDKKPGGSTTSSSVGSTHPDSATLPSSYTFDYLYPPTSKTQAVYEETVKVCDVASIGFKPEKEISEEGGEALSLSLCLFQPMDTLGTDSSTRSRMRERACCVPRCERKSRLLLGALNGY